jgi:hypothetical protein
MPSWLEKVTAEIRETGLRHRWAARRATPLRRAALRGTVALGRLAALGVSHAGSRVRHLAFLVRGRPGKTSPALGRAGHPDERRPTMTEPSLQTLARRLDELERENRRLKAAALLALLGLVAAGVLGQASLSGPPTVEAQRFYVRDGDGKARALLDADGLAFLDPDGRARTLVGRDRLVINDGAGKVVWKAP